uniref:EGF-like domain-containing protein n=1 Tax=viral metagenome TaxID=1070528 RepID=A0A6C0LYD7_9ZZZZ
MRYNIDPCKACWNKYKDEGVNINDLNNCYVETSAAFSATKSALQIPEWCQCISKKMADLPYRAGKPLNFGNNQFSTAVSWNSIPHYFPSLLETNLPDQALKLCHELCNSNECRDNCITDRNSVIEQKPKLDAKTNYNSESPKTSCSCSGNGSCSGSNNICSCNSGFKGKNCEVAISTSWFWKSLLYTFLLFIVAFLIVKVYKRVKFLRKK